jgi:hypothetical protein
MQKRDEMERREPSNDRTLSTEEITAVAVVGRRHAHMAAAVPTPPTNSDGSDEPQASRKVSEATFTIGGAKFSTKNPLVKKFIALLAIIVTLCTALGTIYTVYRSSVESGKVTCIVASNSTK